MTFRTGNVDVLVLKTETDDAVKEKALSEFLGAEGIRLVKSNTAEQKPYAEQYVEFKQRIRFSDEFFREMYESKYARHFYDDAEIQRHIRYWHGPAEGMARER